VFSSLVVERLNNTKVCVAAEQTLSRQIATTLCHLKRRHQGYSDGGKMRRDRGDGGCDKVIDG
jgi:hypothetical protein